MVQEPGPTGRSLSVVAGAECNRGRSRNSRSLPRVAIRGRTRGRSLVWLQQKCFLPRRQSKIQFESGAVGKVAVRSVTTHCVRSPQCPVFGLDHRAWISAKCWRLAAEGSERLKHRPLGRRNRHDGSGTAAAVVVGEPEIVITGQEESLRRAGSKGVDLREELQMGAIQSNLEEPFAARSVFMVQAIKITVRADGQPRCGGGRQTIGRWEIQRNGFEGSRGWGVVEQGHARRSKGSPVESAV